MDEFNRYLSEAIRVRRTIQVYSEIFDCRESIDILSSKSIEFGAILKRSMHDEILISLARLFDTDAYESKKERHEYLSQRNLILKYEDSLDEMLQNLRNKTSQLWNEVSVKKYRDFKLYHNVTFDSAKELVETSINLVLGLMAKNGITSVSSNLNYKYENVGSKFIESIK